MKASLNEKIIDEEEFNALSKLSSIEDLQPDYITFAPHQNLMQVLKALVELVGVFDNFSKKITKLN